MTNEPVHMLLVEDDEVDAMVFERAFKELKVALPITRTRDGIEALEKLRDRQSMRRPYLIVLDLNMPRMGGFEFLEEIRQDKELQDSIVFVFTTSRAEKDIARAYKYNIAGYLCKDDAGEGYSNAKNLLDSYKRLIEFP